MKEILKKKQKDKIYKDLITDSQTVSFGQKIHLDFFQKFSRTVIQKKKSNYF